MQGLRWNDKRECKRYPQLRWITTKRRAGVAISTVRWITRGSREGIEAIRGGTVHAVRGEALDKQCADLNPRIESGQPLTPEKNAVSALR